jgi:hypothetical protein
VALPFIAMNRQGGTGQGDSIQSWFNNVPIITKIFLVGTLLTATITSFRFVSPETLVLIWPYVVEKFQIWRLVTPFFFAGSFSFNFAMHLYVLYENCLRYESNPFDTGGGGNSSDFLWMICLTSAALLVISYIFDLYLLSEPMLYVIMYIWSRREPASLLNIFGFRFKSIYLPWVYIAIRLLMGGAISEPLIGIGVGHLYYFLIEVLPVSYGRRVIFTPNWCVKFISRSTGFTISTAAPRPPQQAPRNAPDRNTNRPTYNWGRGRTLGNE